MHIYYINIYKKSNSISQHRVKNPRINGIVLPPPWHRQSPAWFFKPWESDI
jgi:hypothetical protein